ncbi:hypothetical protein [Demequina maris]|uniref:hypothetical protein n=1 Tax=Demequina maris TaxID=1638982 RepID=UPI000780D010|nr:hypothetical protein [Demequina maris]
MAERHPHPLGNLAIRAAAIRAVTHVLDVPCEVHGARVGEWCDPTRVGALGICEARISREQRTRGTRLTRPEARRWAEERARRLNDFRERERRATESRRAAVAIIHGAPVEHHDTNPDDNNQEQS